MRQYEVLMWDEQSARAWLQRDEEDKYRPLNFACFSRHCVTTLITQCLHDAQRRIKEMNTQRLSENDSHRLNALTGFCFSVLSEIWPEIWAKKYHHQAQLVAAYFSVLDGNKDNLAFFTQMNRDTNPLSYIQGLYSNALTPSATLRNVINSWRAPVATATAANTGMFARSASTAALSDDDCPSPPQQRSDTPPPAAAAND